MLGKRILEYSNMMVAFQKQDMNMIEMWIQEILVGKQKTTQQKRRKTILKKIQVYSERMQWMGQM